MTVINLEGQIGSGKTALADMLGKELNTPVYHESVKDNQILPLFYKDPKQYAFLLQIYFLNTRFADIKKAMLTDNSLLDRSILGDALFFHTNYELGRVTKEEVNVYDDLLENMLEEVSTLPKKRPDLMIYIHTDYDTTIKHIKKRGRSFEQIENDSSLETYYKALLDNYDKWYDNYNESPKMMIDGTKVDFVSNTLDRKLVIDSIKDCMKKEGLLNG